MLGYDDLLKEKCSYEKYVEINKFNEKDYAVPTELDCFISFDFTNDRNFQEQNVTLTKKVFIKNTFEPSSFDKIDGLEIKSIKPVKGLLTPIIGWEIIL